VALILRVRTTRLPDTPDRYSYSPEEFLRRVRGKPAPSAPLPFGQLPFQTTDAICRGPCHGGRFYPGVISDLSRSSRRGW
jgi:hypothetical protein